MYLTPEILQQLAPLIGGLNSNITLTLNNDVSEATKELQSFLEEFTALSPKLKIQTRKLESTGPAVALSKEDQKAKIVFRGIPGGHELSSFVLALLHLDGQGKWPDQALQERVKRIRGPVRVKTFMSLTCENCPDVVQALNQLSLIHPDFEHEIVDGALFPKEAETHGVQGVPSTFAESQKLIHTGRAQLIDLISTLEKIFGFDSPEANVDLGQFDVLILGGGPAGTSAAIYSARKGFRTAIVSDKVGGQVQMTKGIENFISVPYTEGPELSAQLSAHLKNYPITLFENRRVKDLTLQASGMFLINLEGGETLTGNKIIVATGAKWRELQIPGEKEYLGRGVAFCPHCDGPFYKGKTVAVVGGGNSGVEAAIDLAGIAKHVTLIEYGAKLKADEILQKKLYSLPNIKVLTNTKTEEILGSGGKVTGIKTKNMTEQKSEILLLDGVFVQIGLVPNSHFLKGKVETTRGGEIIVDEKGRTSMGGIYAAGDVTTTPFKQIIIAMGEGAKVALTLFEDSIYKEQSA